MGKLAVQKYFALMMLIITFLLMIMTFTGLYGGHVHPGGNTARAMLVYALPILIIGNAIFLIYWLSDGWAMCSLSAALEKDPSSARIMTYWYCLRFIFSDDDRLSYRLH